VNYWFESRTGIDSTTYNAFSVKARMGTDSTTINYTVTGNCQPANVTLSNTDGNGEGGGADDVPPSAIRDLGSVSIILNNDLPYMPKRDFSKEDLFEPRIRSNWIRLG